MEMTDIEITKLCAKAMGWMFVPDGPAPDALWRAEHYSMDGKIVQWAHDYNPLHDDAQAMALVRHLVRYNDNENWTISNHVVAYDRRDFHYMQFGDFSTSAHLNRAICECVANMQKGK